MTYKYWIPVTIFASALSFGAGKKCQQAPQLELIQRGENREQAEQKAIRNFEAINKYFRSLDRDCR
jgi:hypothetical protein